VSINDGQNWVAMRNNMPTIAVHDLLVHPRENDLVVGTFGRGVYITDISPLQEINRQTLEKEVHLFHVEPAVQRITRGWGNYNLYGDRHITVPNASDTIVFYYYLKENKNSPVRLAVSDAAGTVLARLDGPSEAGLNKLSWNMRVQRDASPAQSRGRFGSQVDPGDYEVTLEVGETKLSQKFTITERKGWPIIN
jgi:hypothetical protein